MDIPFTATRWEISGVGTVDPQRIEFSVGCVSPDNWATIQLPGLRRRRWRVDVESDESCPGNTVVWVVAQERTGDSKAFRVLTGWMLDGSEGSPVFDAANLEDDEVIELRFKLIGGGIRCGSTVLQKVRLTPDEESGFDAQGPHAPR